MTYKPGPAKSGNEPEGFLGNGENNSLKEEVVLSVSVLDISSRILSLVLTLCPEASTLLKELCFIGSLFLYRVE